MEARMPEPQRVGGMRAIQVERNRGSTLDGAKNDQQSSSYRLGIHEISTCMCGVALGGLTRRERQRQNYLCAAVFIVLSSNDACVRAHHGVYKREAESVDAVVRAHAG